MLTKTNDLSSMLSPKSIAVIGASGDKRKIGYKLVSNLKEIGYEGKVYLVNPRYEQIEEYPCYQNITDLPLNIDLVLVSVSSAKVMEVLEQLNERQVRSIIILSSGYAETGEAGAKLESEISKFSLEKSIPICGPNTIGVANFKERFIASFSSLKPAADDSIAFVTQSGALGTLSYTLSKEIGIGFHYFVSSGNEAGTDFFDYIHYLAGRQDVKVIGGYLEGARDFNKMDHAIKACHENKKPLVLMKVGNSKKGAEAATSHTASIAGNAEIYENYLELNNIVRVSDEEELTDTLAVFTKTVNPEKLGGVALVTQSGGAGIIMTDRCEERKIAVSELANSTKMKLNQVLPSFASVKNPVDMTAQVAQSPEMIIDTVEITLQDENVDSLVLYLQMTDEKFLTILPRLSDIAKSSNKRLIFCWSGISEETKEKVLKHRDICWIPNPTRAINALSNVRKYYRNNRGIEYGKKEKTRITDEKHLKINGTLNEWESKQLLKEYGVTVPKGKMITSIRDLENEQWTFPLVMKAVSSKIEHKSDYGLVELNINSHEKASRAYKRIMENKKACHPTRELDGILVEEMAPVGTEVIVGALNDETFGPSIMLGMGGVFVELMKDVVIHPAPLNHYQALKMIKSLKNYQVLEGVRNKSRVDIEVLAEVIVRISEMIIDLGDSITELDINPIIVHEKGKGVTAVDALIIGK
ncbi:acetate--CoA ligase family protein [Virgibacillus sediminis]|uniref:Acetate--CoA ligase family protein n=1 Tax=Virgibacillus sediminis TaxID=202260 RepID=A0ABV7A8T2_9BACI